VEKPGALRNLKQQGANDVISVPLKVDVFYF